MNKTLALSLGALVLAGFLGAAFYMSQYGYGGRGAKLECSTDVKVCPDGSSVRRVAPSCEFAACPGSLNEDAGTLSGTVTLSPTCAVETMPPDPTCAPRPYVTSVRVVTEGGEEVVARANTTSEGKYVLNLPPGTYRLQAGSGEPLPRCEEKTVRITAGSRTVSDISCDTGIR